MTNPTFGEKKQDVTYVNRYGVYAALLFPIRTRIISSSFKLQMGLGSYLAGKSRQVKITCKL